MEWRGIFPALLTPFTPGGERVDEDQLRQYVEFLIARGVQGLFVNGTNGVGPLLSLEERKRVAEVVVKQVRGRLPVLVQAGAISTAEAAELAKHAQEIGAAGVALVAPYYFEHDEPALAAHFGRVASLIGDFPVFLYHIPANARNDLKPALVRQLAERYPNIVGIKDSSKDFNRLLDYLGLLPAGFKVFVGTDSLVLPALVMGANGAVTGVGNVFPEVMVQLYEAFLADDLDRAREIQFQVIRIREALKGGPPLSTSYFALNWRGLPFGAVRPPFRPLTREEEEKVKRALEGLNLSSQLVASR